MDCGVDSRDEASFDLWCRGIRQEQQESELDRLKRENAELRRQVNEVKSKRGYNIYLEDKITIDKAKHIIKQLVEIYCYRIEYDEDGNVLKQAEQFLKEQA